MKKHFLAVGLMLVFTLTFFSALASADEEVELAAIVITASEIAKDLEGSMQSGGEANEASVSTKTSKVQNRVPAFTTIIPAQPDEAESKSDLASQAN